MHLKVSLHLSKKTILITLGILSLIGAGVAFYILQSSKNPLPSDIHPYAQFKSNLGQVALTKFWQSGNLKPEGQSAVLASNGTFLIAHSERNLTNTQWKGLFESLKITR
jgi:hypothetical protein